MSVDEPVQPVPNTRSFGAKKPPLFRKLFGFHGAFKVSRGLKEIVYYIAVHNVECWMYFSSKPFKRVRSSSQNMRLGLCLRGLSHSNVYSCGDTLIVLSLHRESLKKGGMLCCDRQGISRGTLHPKRSLRGFT